MKDAARYWDASLVAGGVLLAGLTLKAYQRFDAPSGQAHQNQLTPQQAASVAASAKTFLNSNPEDFNAWSNLGIASYYKGPEAYAEGLNAIQKARSLGATSESLFYYAGVMYEALGLPAYAQNEMEKYRRHHPDDYEAQLRLANLLAQQKKTDEAYALYQSLSGKGSRDPVLWFNFGIVSKDKGDLDGALACFAKVKQWAKPLPEGELFYEGEIARLKGSDDQALALYQQELSLHPRYLPALVALEAAQRRKNLWKEAKETRQTIAALKAQ